MSTNYEQLFVLVSVAVFTVTGTALSMVVACTRRWVEHRSARFEPRRRARIWMAIRFCPAVSALLFSVGFGVAFLRHEPRHVSEQAGGIPLGLVAGALVFVAAAAWRVAASTWQTARCHRLLRRVGVQIGVPNVPFPAWQVPVDFPLAAVSGVLNPRLILSSRVIDECPADELGMVLRHEVAHARHRDNLVHLGLLACPDLLGLTTWGNRLISNWRQAVEEAADEEAVGSDTSGRTALASALVRVARMAASGRPSWMPALALFDGHPLEARVRRLLTRDRQCAWQPLRLRVKVAGAFAVAAVIWLATGPRLLHACVEWGVRNLP